MQQIRFSESAYAHKKKTTRNERFFTEMDDLLPWKHLLKPITRKFPKPDNGRRPIPPEVMLRIYSMQHMYRDMIPVIRFILITVVALVAMDLRALADSPIDAEDAVRGGVILKAGAIDSSTVEVGAFAVVIHGQGERQPVSGEWEQLATVRGYVQGVDAETLTLAMGRGGRTRRVSFDRIQTLVLIGVPSPDTLSVENLEPASRRSAQSQAGPMEDRGHRILAKLAAGMASSLAVTTISAIFLGKMAREPEEVDGDDPWAGSVLTYVWGGSIIGWSVGFPLGVTWVDPHDSSSKTMLAGVASGGVATSLFFSIQEPKLFLPSFLLMYVGPIIGSMTVSEISTKPPEDRRVSVALSPTPHGGLSAVATLRF